MQINRLAGVKLSLVRVAYFDFPKPIVAGYVALAVLGYIFVAVHTPLTLYPALPHDDGLFMSHGLSLSEGKWLGPFSEFTLMKGPGYPAFLAVGNWLGISVSLAHVLFHCAAIFFFVWVAHQFIRSQLLSGGMFMLLLWHPAPITVPLFRILRDQIYYAQTLLFFGLLICALFLERPKKQRILAAALAGASLGWFWLTREEGIWIVPGIAVLVAASLLRAAADRRLGALAATLAILISVFAASQMAFAAANWWYYGKFVGVDFKEANFQRALGALHSVRSGGTKPFVSVTLAAREQIYPVSPAFASLSPYLDGPSGKGWAGISCPALPASCGEIGSGWFMWALRSVAALKGHYASPARASAFFGLIAGEISTGCADGRLECQRQLVAEMPPWTWKQLLDGLADRYLAALDLLLLVHPPHQFNPSNGTEDLLEPSLRFLGYPMYSPSPDAPPRPPTYAISGWYYRAGDEWPSIAVRGHDGVFADVQLQRSPSPDIAKGTGDVDAARQQFMLRVHCTADCILRVETPEGERFERALSELGSGMIGLELGKAHFQIESTTIHADGGQVPTHVEEFAKRVRVAALETYKFGFIPTLIIGLLAFVLTSVIYWRRGPRNIPYIVALAFWLLAFSRVTLLVLVAATSFPALNAIYFAPTYFMVIAASGFSIAACLQAFAGRPSSPLAADPGANETNSRNDGNQHNAEQDRVFDQRGAEVTISFGRAALSCFLVARNP